MNVVWRGAKRQPKGSMNVSTWAEFDITGMITADDKVERGSPRGETLLCYVKESMRMRKTPVMIALYFLA